MNAHYGGFEVPIEQKHHWTTGDEIAERIHYCFYCDTTRHWPDTRERRESGDEESA